MLQPFSHSATDDGLRDVLTDGRLRLEPIEVRHAEAFGEAVAAAAAGIRRWMGARTAPASPEAVAAYIADWEAGRAEGTRYGWVVVEVESGRLVGFGLLNGIHPVHRFANLGYWVRPEAGGRGYAAAAVRLLAAFAFRRLGLVRVELVIEPGNAASRRVAERAGAVLEGRLRNRLTVDGEARDACMYGLVPGDLEARDAPEAR